LNEELELDYDYVPLTYWPGPWTAGIARTRGSFERWANAGLAPEDAPLFGDSPASLHAGEDLPALHDGDIEIARVELASVLGDVTSVRATRTPTGRIEYSVVDEYQTVFGLARRFSERPLSMRELVQ
jgi:hypothetical protein